MDKRLWNAIQELMDAADYAINRLDRYADYVDDKFSPQLVPNDALSAQSCLKEALATLDALMSKETAQ